MPNVLRYVDKHWRFYADAVRDNKSYARDPEYFKPYGIQTFFGEQGSGKTTALIHFYGKLAARYPKAIVVSNIILKDRTSLKFNTKSELADILAQEIDTTTHYIYYASKEQYELVNRHIRNGKYGVILITDEYQNYFSNQDSRNVPPWVIEQAAQNRKQRRVHLVTSQDYDQLAKPIRRRSDIAFKCRTFALPFTAGPILTVYWAFDAKKIEFDNNGKMSAAKPLKIGLFFHSKQLRESFDTHQVVFTGDQADGVYRSSQPTVKLKQTALPLKRTAGIFRLPRS